MGADDRIRFLAREEIQRVRFPLDPGSVELREEENWAERLDDLHRELHAMATKVAALETRLSSLPVPNPEAVPVATRGRKVPGS